MRQENWSGKMLAFISRLGCHQALQAGFKKNIYCLFEISDFGWKVNEYTKKKKSQIRKINKQEYVTLK